MKNRIFILILILISIVGWQCRSARDGAGVKAEVIAHDSTQYELVVMDSGYEQFLASEAKPINFYSNEYYSSWNQRYVTEWNIRCHNPRRYGSFYVMPIDYSPHVDYGIELNYRLYNYFLFIERDYRIVLVPRGLSR